MRIPAGEDALVAVIADSGSRVSWNTFMGSSKDDQGQALAFDGEGNILVAGTSQASWSTPIRAHSGGQDAFVAKLQQPWFAPLEYLFRFGRYG